MPGLRIAVLFLLASVLFAGCASNTSVVMVDRIREGNGYALIVIHTNWKPWEMGLERLQLQYAAVGGERRGTVRMRRSGELELVELPAGEYRWEAMQLGSQRVSLTEASGFHVAEGIVTYIGDLSCTWDRGRKRIVEVGVQDNAGIVRERFAEANAPLLERYRLDTQLMTLAPVTPLAPRSSRAGMP